MEFITINSDFKIYIIYDLFVFLNLRSIIDFLDFNKNVINQNYRLLKVFIIFYAEVNHLSCFSSL